LEEEQQDFVSTIRNASENLSLIVMIYSISPRTEAGNDADAS
jgi:hypothetical protein